MKIATTPASPCGSWRGPVDVAEPQRDRVDPVQAPIERQIALGGELRLPVGRVGPALGALVERQLATVALAVDRAAGGGEDEALDRGPARALEQVDRSADVDPEVVGRVGDRDADVDLGGEVADELRAGARRTPPRPRPRR